MKCFKGKFEVTKNTSREKELELKECTEYDDVCVSLYMRTDTTIEDGREVTYLAGSWEKGCGKKGSRGLEVFGGEESDRCIELKDEDLKHVGLKVCNINS